MNLNREYVSKEALLKEISDVDVYKCYGPTLEIELNKRQMSPLRKENNPSFALFAKNGEILFKDFVLGGGDCIRFVQMLFKESFFDSLSRVVIDFGLTDKFIYRDVQASHKPSTKVDREEIMKQAGRSLIQIKRRKWLMKDMHYWVPFGIQLGTLKYYNVVPISHFFVNDTIINCKGLAYAYVEFKDGIETYKIYQPLKDEYKWLNNHDDSVWQGWEQLPEKGEELIITKSLKDVMTIYALTGKAAVALQAESVNPKDHIIEELQERFKFIWVWYDNDFDKEVNWGREYGASLAETYNLIQIEIPDEHKIKDPSDFCKKKGNKATIELIRSLTDVPF